MKKLLSLILALCMVLTFAACAQEQTQSEATSEIQSEATSETQEPAQEGAVYNVGILQHVQHNALDQAAQGFQDELTRLAQEAGVTVNFDLQNASNDAANGNLIAQKFVNDGVDLILAIATPSAQGAAQATSEIPILITAVTDPVGANLVASNEAPGGNISGTSDLNPIDLQANLLVQLVPDAKTVGIMYTSSEDNSITQAELAQAAFEDLGLAVEVATFTDSNDIQSVTTNLISKVDALYLPTDNTLASSMPTVAMVTQPAKIPVICGEENMVMEGGLATYSLDYYTLGQMTGEQAFEVLVNGADVSTMPIGYSTEDELKLVINEEYAAAIELEIPEDLLQG